MQDRVAVLHEYCCSSLVSPRHNEVPGLKWNKRERDRAVRIGRLIITEQSIYIVRYWLGISDFYWDLFGNHSAVTAVLNGTGITFAFL